MDCPTGCVGSYSAKQYLHIVNDDQGIPEKYLCPQCGYSRPLTLKEKILEIIYQADWYFNLPEYWDMDEYYIEESDVDNVISDIVSVVADSIKQHVTRR